MSLLDREHYENNPLDKIAQLEARIAKLERQTPFFSLQVPVSQDNVGNPPTDAQLDEAFGQPATVGAGFVAIVDDNGAGTAIWLVASDGASWWYEQLSQAV